MHLISPVKTALSDLKTVAVIGCSSNPYRTSFHIAKYMVDEGIEMIPINPNETEVLGKVCYASIFDVPENITIDVVDIFRNKKYTEEMVREIVEWSKKTGQKPVIWTQLDVSTNAAKKLAGDNGFDYVENSCFMVEHRSFHNP